MTANNDALLQRLIAKADSLRIGWQDTCDLLREAAAAIRALGADRGEAAYDEACALEHFCGYFRNNYPGPTTIISKPDWHAPKIFRAALYAIKQATPPSPAVIPPELQGGDDEGQGASTGDIAFINGWNSCRSDVIRRIHAGSPAESADPSLDEKADRLVHGWPAAPSGVSDADVERACDAYLKDNLVHRVVDRSRMRAALEAAQPQPGRVEGMEWADLPWRASSSWLRSASGSKIAEVGIHGGLSQREAELIAAAVNSYAGATP